jgi:predicted RNA binding protein YcfA (HicA-like mRNA interferase family)
MPVHGGRDIGPALLRTILREAEVSIDEFLAALRS